MPPASRRRRPGRRNRGRPETPTERGDDRRTTYRVRTGSAARCDRSSPTGRGLSEVHQLGSSADSLPDHGRRSLNLHRGRLSSPSFAHGSQVGPPATPAPNRPPGCRMGAQRSRPGRRRWLMGAVVGTGDKGQACGPSHEGHAQQRRGQTTHGRDPFRSEHTTGSRLFLTCDADASMRGWAGPPPADSVNDWILPAVPIDSRSILSMAFFLSLLRGRGSGRMRKR